MSVKVIARQSSDIFMRHSVVYVKSIVTRKSVVGINRRQMYAVVPL